MPKIIKLNDIIEKLKSINPNIEVIRELKNSRNERCLECRCIIHNHIWVGAVHHLCSGIGCPECKKENIAKALRTDIDIVKSSLMELGYTPLFENYYNSNTKLKLQDKDGYIVYGRYSKIIIGEYPRPFSSINPDSIYNLKLWIKKNNKDIELLSKEVDESWPRLQVKCKICGKVWEISVSNLLKDRNCPICSINNRSGEFHHNWNGGTSNIREYLRAKIDTWKYDSMKKYNFKCDISGISSPKNVAHHIFPFSKIVKESISNLNLTIHKEVNKYTKDELLKIERECLRLHYDYGLGVCLSEELHDLFHKTYGYKDFGADDYTEFKRNIIRDSIDDKL